MSEPGSDEGWNVAKVLGLIVALLGMVGFGVCGLCGLVLSKGGGPGTAFVLACGIAGLVIAAVFLLLVLQIFRSTRRNPPDAS